METSIVQRLRGAAVGAAVGDALGMPFEFGPARPLGNLVSNMRSGRLPAGSFTDDTEMAIALGESLLAHRPLDPADLAGRFLDWLHTSPPDVGIHTARVLNWMSTGADWPSASRRAASVYPNSAGNGSVMRCWPVALAWWDDPSGLDGDSALQSRVTHPHEDCCAACVLVNRMVVALIQGASPREALEGALPYSGLRREFSSLVTAAPFEPRDRLANSGWVRHTVQSAVWGLLTTHSFSDALTQVVNLGADADTAGAVVGALAGAAYGLNAIPPAWRQLLHGEWPHSSGHTWYEQDLITLADRLSSKP